MSIQFPTRSPLLHRDAHMNATGAIEVERDSLSSSPAHRSMSTTREQLKSLVKSTISNIFQPFYTVDVSDTPKSKAPKRETPSCSPQASNSISQAVPSPIRRPGYNSEHLQDATHTGLGARLKEAWKSALPPRDQCVGCFEEVPLSKLITAPCAHKYCPNCIYNMASIAMRTTTLFPVRCCGQEIPAKAVGSTMGVRERKLYLSRVDEHAVPAADRWYCPQTNCRRWIHPRNFVPSKPLKCPHCRTLMCLDCRDIAHDSRVCAYDPSLNEVLLVAQQKHWQRCFSCHTLVEKIEGCRHMKCVCKAEFCYQCGRPWEIYAHSCRGAAEEVTGAVQMGYGELDVTTVVAAMEQAEREDEEEILREQYRVGWTTVIYR